MKNIKLSISLLVSNSIDTIEKCMESLKKIADKISTEIIVVDTGGTDGSIEVAKKYATKIVPFEWCNDFAKARNEGLKEATGEWYLFLDDDEWFDDIEELVSFFESREEKNYNCASYIIRNYYNMEGLEWEEVRSTRISRLTTELKFECPIHETLSPVKGPEKILNTFVHHYGYVYNTEEEKIKHANRNIVILEEVLRKDRDQRLIVQLAQEYRSIDNYEVSENLSLKAIKDIGTKKVPIISDIKYMGWHMVNVLFMEKQKGNYQKAFYYGNEFLNNPLINDITKNNLSNILVELCYHMQNTNDIIKYWEIYNQTYKYFKNNKSNIYQYCILNQDETLRPIFYLSSTLLCLKFNIMNNCEDFALYFAKKMIEENLNEYPGIIKEISDFIKGIIKENAHLTDVSIKCLKMILSVIK